MSIKKEISEVSDRSDYVIHELTDAIAAGNAGKMEGALEILLSNNDINDMTQALSEKDLQSIGFKNGFNDPNLQWSYERDADGNIKKDSHGHDVKKLNISTENQVQVLNALYNTMGIHGEERAKAFMTISDKAQASGNFSLGGLANFNADKHKFDINDEQGRAFGAAAKFANMEAQQQARVLHPDSLTTRDANGNFQDLNGATAKALISKMTKATADQSNRARTDMVNGIAALWEEAKAGRAQQFREEYESNETFRYYVAQMLNQKGTNITGGKKVESTSDPAIPKKIPTGGGTPPAASGA